jgi:hypothetical protein
MLGEHTDAIQMALGYCQSAIDQLRRSETIK